MNIFQKLVDLFSDLRRMGPQFVVAGVRQRFTNGLIPLDLFGHRVWIRGHNSDFATLRRIFSEQEYALNNAFFDAQLEKRYREILATGKRPVIIDAGANIGGASLWFARQFPEASIAAIEPDHGNAELLRRNATDFPSVRVFEAAIGSQKGFVELSSEEKGWAVQTERAQQGVAIVTVNDILEAFPDDTLFIVKVDIEGFEKDLFAENTAWIDAAEAIFIEPHDWLRPGEQTSRTFQQALFGRNFSIAINGENLIFIKNHTSV